MTQALARHGSLDASADLCRYKPDRIGEGAPGTLLARGNAPAAMNLHSM